MILSDDEDVKPFRGGSGIKREPDIDLTAYRGRPGSFYEEKPDIKRMKLDPEVEIMDVKPNAALLAAMRDRELLVAAQQARYEQQRQAVIRNAALLVEQRQVIQARREEQGDEYKAVVDAEGAVDDDAYKSTSSQCRVSFYFS